MKRRIDVEFLVTTKDEGKAPIGQDVCDNDRCVEQIENTKVS